MSDGPNVLLVSPEYPPIPGGIGDYTALLARHLGLMGATVTVLTSGTGGDERDESGVRILRTIPRWDWGLTERVHNAIRLTGAEIVHIQYQTGMYAMHPAVNLLPWTLGWHTPVLYQAFPSQFPPPLQWQFRVVTTFHDLRPPYLFPKTGLLRNGVTRFLARTSDAVIATNGTDAATLRRWGTRPVLVPIGSNIPTITDSEQTAEARQRFRVQYGIALDAVLLTTFGLLNQSKGLDTIIDTLALLREEGTPAHLLLIGAGVGANDPTNRATDATVSARIAVMGLTPFVSRTGLLPARGVADALAWSDVCLLPYRDGASPRRGSLLAALAQGVPVITTMPEGEAYAGLPSLTGTAVAFVPPDNVAAMVAAVRHILVDTRYTAQLRLGARSYAAHFAWEAIARSTLAVYAGNADDAQNALQNYGVEPQRHKDTKNEEKYFCFPLCASVPLWFMLSPLRSLAIVPDTGAKAQRQSGIMARVSAGAEAGRE